MTWLLGWLGAAVPRCRDGPRAWSFRRSFFPRIRGSRCTRAGGRSVGNRRRRSGSWRDAVPGRSGPDLGVRRRPVGRGQGRVPEERSGPEIRGRGRDHDGCSRGRLRARSRSARLSLALPRLSLALRWLSGRSWRKGWDSNPRMVAHRRFSRPVHSTALPPFRGAGGGRDDRAPARPPVLLAPCGPVGQPIGGRHPRRNRRQARRRPAGRAAVRRAGRNERAPVSPASMVRSDRAVRKGRTGVSRKEKGCPERRKSVLDGLAGAGREAVERRPARGRPSRHGTSEPRREPEAATRSVAGLRGASGDCPGAGKLDGRRGRPMSGDGGLEGAGADRLSSPRPDRHHGHGRPRARSWPGRGAPREARHRATWRSRCSAPPRSRACRPGSA